MPTELLPQKPCAQLSAEESLGFCVQRLLQAQERCENDCSATEREQALFEALPSAGERGEHMAIGTLVRGLHTLSQGHPDTTLALEGWLAPSRILLARLRILVIDASHSHQHRQAALSTAGQEVARWLAELFGKAHLAKPESVHSMLPMALAIMSLLERQRAFEDELAALLLLRVRNRISEADAISHARRLQLERLAPVPPELLEARQAFASGTQPSSQRALWLRMGDAELSMMLRANPEPEAQALLAESQLDLGQGKKALTLLAPLPAELALPSRAHALLALGRDKEAKQAFVQAFEFGLASAPEALALAQLATAEKAWVAAESWLERGREEAPDWPPLARASAALAREALDAAERALAQAKASEDLSPAHALLQLAQRMANPQLAVRHLCLAFALRCAEAELQLALEELAAQSEETLRALGISLLSEELSSAGEHLLEYSEELLSRFGNQPWSLALVARALLLRGDVDQAMAAIGAALSRVQSGPADYEMELALLQFRLRLHEQQRDIPALAFTLSQALSRYSAWRNSQTASKTRIEQSFARLMRAVSTALLHCDDDDMQLWKHSLAHSLPPDELAAFFAKLRQHAESPRLAIADSAEPAREAQLSTAFGLDSKHLSTVSSALESWHAFQPANCERVAWLARELRNRALGIKRDTSPHSTSEQRTESSNWQRRSIARASDAFHKP
jgi:hypothetical protein